MTNDIFKNFPDTFTFQQFELFFDSSVYDRAVVLAPFIRKICFILPKKKGKEIYINQQNFTFLTSTDIDNYVLTIVSKFFNQSLNSLKTTNVSDYELLKKQFKKEVDYIQTNQSINQYKPQLMTFLNEDINIEFNITPHEIHFKNGFIDTSTGDFKPREKEYFITNYIKYDYIPSTEEEQLFVMENLSKIYPNEIDRDIVLGNISVALSWEATKNQTSLFLTGSGSAGKSFIMKLLKKVLGPYFVELSGDTFSSNIKNDKKLNTMFKNPQALIAWLNELDETKMKTSIFKEFCEGITNTEVLYEDGSHNTRHYAYAISTSNGLPNMIQDSGTQRRLAGYTHTSTFTDNVDEVDEANHIYFKNTDLLDKMPSNAVIDVFVRYCVAWFKNRQIYDVSKSKNFQSTSDIMKTSNDFFQDFIDQKLIITKNETDRIGKDRMRDLYLETFPDKHISVLQVISSMRDKKIEYNKDCRFNNIRGCFIGVKEHTDTMEEANEKCEKDLLIEQLQKELQELTKKYKSAKHKLHAKNKFEELATDA